MMRTDRHNNPTAMTTDVAKTLGLVYGKDYVEGDPFPDNPKMKTARLLGNPIATTTKAMDLAASRGIDPFYTQNKQPRWTHTAIPTEQWKTFDANKKKQVILDMYKHEGGSGQLAKMKSFADLIDELRGKGGSDTRILDYISHKMPAAAPKINELRAKAQQNGKNDRDITNFLSEKFDGRLPSRPSNPLEVNYQNKFAPKTEEQVFINHNKPQTEEETAALSEVYKKVQEDRGQILVKAAEVGADPNITKRLYDTHDWDKLKKYLTDSASVSKVIDKQGGGGLQAIANFIDAAAETVNKAANAVGNAPGIKQAADLAGKTVGAAAEYVVGKPSAALGQATGQAIANVNKGKSLLEGTGKAATEGLKAGSSGVTTEAIGELIANIDRLATPEGLARVMESYNRNKQTKGLQDEFGGMVEAGVKNFIIGQLTGGVGKISPALSTTLNSLMVAGMGKDGYNNVRDGLKENDPKKVSEGIASLSMALMAAKSTASGIKSGQATKLVSDKANVGPTLVKGQTNEQKLTKTVQQTLQDKSVKIDTLKRNQEASERAVRDVDLNKVKTSSEVVKRAQAAENSVKRAIDTISDEPVPTLKKDYSLKIDNIATALDDLKKANKGSIEGTEKYIALENKYNSEGLTPREVNQIARDLNTVKPSFNAQGEVLRSKQAIADTRTGVKEAFRNMFPKETAKTLADLDKRYSDIIKFRERMQSQEAKVYKARAGAKEENKAMQVVETGLNIASVGTEGVIKNAIFGALRKALRGESMTPLEAEKLLTRNAKRIEALKGKTGKTLDEGLNDIIKIERERILKQQALDKFKASQNEKPKLLPAPKIKVEAPLTPAERAAKTRAQINAGLKPGSTTKGSLIGGAALGAAALAVNKAVQVDREVKDTIEGRNNAMKQALDSIDKTNKKLADKRVDSTLITNNQEKKFNATYYHPEYDSETRKGGNGVGAFGRKVEFGDVAIGDRTELQALKDKARKGGDTFIFIKDLADVKTPWGNGVFRINDVKNKRYDKTESFDIALNPSMPNYKELKKKIGNKELTYIKLDKMPR